MTHEITVREVAKFSSPLFIEIVKEFNFESLDGITDWSHCWIVFLDSMEVGMKKFKIESRKGRKLFLSSDASTTTLPNTIRIIDIKPIHACDIEE